MRTGALRHLVTFQQDTGTTQDSKGAPVSVWTQSCRAWGELAVLAGREAEALRQRYASADYRLRVRADSGTRAVTPRMRAILGPVNTDGSPATGARLFDILENVDPDGRNRERAMVLTERNL